MFAVQLLVVRSFQSGPCWYGMELKITRKRGGVGWIVLYFCITVPYKKYNAMYNTSWINTAFNTYVFG